MSKNKKRILGTSLSFILLMGIVSMFSDMTHEGANSIIGSFLNLLGANATTIGFISGFGVFIGYALRLFSGYIVDKTHKYWLITIIGYICDCFAVPLLALVPNNGWIWACVLMVAEKVGKAIKKPAKDSLISFAAKDTGVGKGFAIGELLDQIGAFLGPLMLFIIMLLTKDKELYDQYQICFACLAIPAVICVGILIFAMTRFPHPEDFEKEPIEENTKNKKTPFILFMIGICFFAFGFLDFSLVTMHEDNIKLISTEYLPLIYAGAMLVDALSALVFGILYDKKGMLVLFISTMICSTYSLFIFSINEVWSMIVGIILWGIGMGATESVFKAALTNLSTKNKRSKAFGIFDSIFGLSWFLGSTALGALYDYEITTNDHMIWLSIITIACQVIGAFIFLIIYINSKKEKKLNS
ncbi:MAG: MFS transporter [Bacilli bacterium]